MAIAVGTGVVKIVPDFKGFQSAVSRQFTTNLQRVGAQADQLGRSLLPLSLAAAGVFALGAKAAIDFEAELAKTKALVGETDENLRELTKGIKRLAQETGRGPAELAKALFFVESAGLRGSDAMLALEQAARLSAAGLGDTKDIADALTSALNAYALSGLTAAEASDILVATIREGKLETDTLSQSIGRVIPIAAQLGVEFHEVGAAIAASTKVGLSAEEATTALRQALVTILKPSAEAAATLESFGFSASELRKKVRDEGLLSTLQELRDTFGDDADAINRVFQNVRALTGIFALVGENSAQVQQVFDELADAAGDADDAFAIVAETTKFKLSQAFAQLQVALIDLGEVALPVVNAFAEGIGTLARLFSGLPDTIKTFVSAGLGIVALSAPILLIVGRMASLAASLSIVKTGHLQAASAAATQARALAVLGGASAIPLSTAATNSGLRNALVPSFQRAAAPTSAISRSALGLGFAMSGFIAAGLIKHFPTQEETLGRQVQETMAGALNFAGVGAGVGFVVGGPLGAAIGGLGGAIIGGLTSFLSSKKNDVQDGIEDTLKPRPPTISSLFQSGRQAANAITSAFAESLELSDAVSDELAQVRDELADITGEITDTINQFSSGFVLDFFDDPFEGVGDDPELFGKLATNLEHVREHRREIQDEMDVLGGLGLIGIQSFVSGLSAPDQLQTLRAIRLQILNDPLSVFNLNNDILDLTPLLEAGFNEFLEALTIGDDARRRLDIDAEAFRNFFRSLSADRPDVAQNLLADLQRLGEFDFAGVLQTELEISLLPIPTLEEGAVRNAIEQVFTEASFRNVIEDTALSVLLGDDELVTFETPIAGVFEIDQAATVAALLREIDKFPNTISPMAFGAPFARNLDLSGLLGEIVFDATPEERDERLRDLVTAVFPPETIERLGTEIGVDLHDWATEQFPNIISTALAVDSHANIDKILTESLRTKLDQITQERLFAELDAGAFGGKFVGAVTDGIVSNPFDLTELPQILQDGLDDPFIVDKVFGGGSGLGFELSSGIVSGFDLSWQTDAFRIQSIINRTQFTINPQVNSGNPGLTNEFNNPGGDTFIFGDVTGSGAEDIARTVEETVTDSQLARAFGFNSFK